MNILLVEDDRDTAEMLVMILGRQYQADLRWVDRGDVALPAFLDSPEQPDLVVVDCHLPGKHGPEVAREIRAHDAAVPILAYCSNTAIAEELADVERCLFLAKPFGVHELLMTVDLALSGTTRAPQRTANIL